MVFLILTFIFCLPVIWFALSNIQIVSLGLWPLDYTIDMPVSIAILVAMALGFLIGALVLWISALKQARRARRAEHTVKLLEDQVQDLKSRTTPPLSLSMPPAA
jgi:uncharacterized integral membrane protein